MKRKYRLLEIVGNMNTLIKTKKDKYLAIEVLQKTIEMFPRREEMNIMQIEAEDVLNEMILRIVKLDTV